MPLSKLDTAAVARTLSQIAEQPEDVVDAFFERREDVELAPEGDPGALRVWREEGFAVRLVREGRTWLASRDAIEAKPFAEALRQVARAIPSATYPEPALEVPPFDPVAALELLDFPGALSRAVRAHHVGFPLRVTVRRHRRWVQL
jgi:predicted Zn-dependent protease